MFNKKFIWLGSNHLNVITIEDWEIALEKNSLYKIRKYICYFF